MKNLRIHLLRPLANISETCWIVITFLAKRNLKIQFLIFKPVTLG